MASPDALCRFCWAPGDLIALAEADECEWWGAWPDAARWTPDMEVCDGEG
jgi:hypothetical protein